MQISYLLGLIKILVRVRVRLGLSYVYIRSLWIINVRVRLLS